MPLLISLNNPLKLVVIEKTYLTRVRKANLPFIHVTQFPMFDATHI